jgi:hypothetical protein
MDESYIEINLCDSCLLAAAARGSVLWGRDRAVASVDGSIVGTVTLSRPYALVPWDPEPDARPQARNARLGRHHAGNDLDRRRRPDVN